MVDFLNFVMLLSASLGALAFGVLSAYAVLRFGFFLMRRPQLRTAVVKPRTEVAPIS